MSGASEGKGSQTGHYFPTADTDDSLETAPKGAALLGFRRSHRVGGLSISGMASRPNSQAPGGSLGWDLQEILEMLGMARQAKDCSGYIQVPTAIDP